MGLRLIRQSSDTPNVSNTDDTRMVRYAYGGADGAVKSYGTELAATVNGSTLKIGSGCIVLHGWEVVIDANGHDVTVDNTSVLRYYSVYLEINLATEAYAIRSVYDTAGYPDVEEGEDLTAQTTGTARLPLYQFTAQSGVIENVTPKFSIIEYVKTQIEDIRRRLDGVDGSITVIDGRLDGVDGRLEKLGFKQAVVSGGNSGSQVTRQGNYVIGHILCNKAFTLSLYGSGSSEYSLSISMTPEYGCPYNSFYPKTNPVEVGLSYRVAMTYNPDGISTPNYKITARLNGTSFSLRLQRNSVTTNTFTIGIVITDIYLGYEAVSL